MYYFIKSNKWVFLYDGRSDNIHVTHCYLQNNTDLFLCFISQPYGEEWILTFCQHTNKTWPSMYEVIAFSFDIVILQLIYTHIYILVYMNGLQLAVTLSIELYISKIIYIQYLEHVYFQNK